MKLLGCLAAAWLVVSIAQGQLVMMPGDSYSYHFTSLPLAFTNANAFSPTDTMPLTGRAKLAMQVQALISFAILTLVLARVVSAFT